MKTEKILNNLTFLHNLNSSYQNLDFLQYAKKIENGYEIHQNESKIIFIKISEFYCLFSWLPDIEIPMDDVKIQWDIPSVIHNWLLDKPFPTYFLYSNNLDMDLETPWLATSWWRVDGLTDAIDNPQKWIDWWWFEVMEFSEESPNFLIDDISKSLDIS